MSKKIKIFYIIDIFVVVASIIGIVLNKNTESYGLAALTQVGYFVIFLGLFLISIILLLLVTCINLFKKRKYWK